MKWDWKEYMMTAFLHIICCALIWSKPSSSAFHEMSLFCVCQDRWNMTFRIVLTWTHFSFFFLLSFTFSIFFWLFTWVLYHHNILVGVQVQTLFCCQTAALLETWRQESVSPMHTLSNYWISQLTVERYFYFCFGVCCQFSAGHICSGTKGCIVVQHSAL